MAPYKIAASIVLYDTEKEKSIKAINSFLNSKISDLKLCLVDNSLRKTDYGKELAAQDSRIEYIFNGKNLGYAKGHNTAIKKYMHLCDYHLVLNPDVYFEDNLIGELYERMQRDKNIALCSPDVLFPDGKKQYAAKKLPSPFDVGIRLFSKKLPVLERLIKKMFKKQMDSYELRYLDRDRNFTCPSISGCFMFLRSSVLREIGAFDERFFMYFEDVDLSRRCCQKYKNVVFADKHIYHNWQRDSYKKTKVLKYHVLSAVKYFNKCGWFLDKGRKKMSNSVSYYG
jgi:GT2 family glycosyltransferase